MDEFNRDGSASTQKLLDRIAGLEAAIKTAHTEMMNAQPHIEHCVEKRMQPFIDSHIDVAMAALVAVKPGLMAPDK